MDVLNKNKSAIRLLALFNAILLGVSWLMMVRAYPRLPGEIPYWLPLAGQAVLRAPKGPFFFLYPLFQTLFLLAFYLAGTVWAKKPERGGLREIPEQQENATEKISADGLEKAGEGRAGDSETAGGGLEDGRPGEQLPGGRGQMDQPGAETSRRSGTIQDRLRAELTHLEREMVWLAMIFFNLVFIHVQRSLIWLAHGLSVGVNKYYFFSLLIMILLLIPYYRFRLSLLSRGHR